MVGLQQCSGNVPLYDDNAIPDLLDSRFDTDKVDALKRLLALIAQGVNVSHHFPQKNHRAGSDAINLRRLADASSKGVEHQLETGRLGSNVPDPMEGFVSGAAMASGSGATSMTTPSDYPLGRHIAAMSSRP